MLLQPDERTEASIPTSSMSDIAFLLIIFFMVTAAFSATKGLEMRLPDDLPPEIPAVVDPAIFVEVLEGGVRIDCQPMSHEAILPYLEPRLTRNPHKPVVLYVDPDVSYRRVVRIYDLLVESAGASGTGSPASISIPTRREIQGYIETFGSNPFEDHCRS